MKTKILLIAMLATAVEAGTVFAQINTARNVVNSTVRGTEKAAETVAHGTKKAVDTVADTFTPDTDARRVDVTLTDGRIDMPGSLESGKTAFVVKNEGSSAQNFEVAGRNTDRKFATAPKPGQTKVMHVYLKRGTYSFYAPANGEKGSRKVTARVH
jgi:hypothetical protein